MTTQIELSRVAHDGTVLDSATAAITYDPTGGWSLLLPSDEDTNLCDEMMLLVALFMFIHNEPDMCRRMIDDVVAAVEREG